MRGLLSIIIMLSVTLAVTYAGLLPQTGPATGPSNPRFRRSTADDKNQVSVNANKGGGRRSSYSGGYTGQIYGNDRGGIDASVGVSKTEGQKAEAKVGISGTITF